MYLYVEMWNAKPSWLGLPQGQREAFMKKVDAFLATIKPEDAEVYGCCVNDGDTMPRAGYAYLVVWKVRDKSCVKAIADGTAAVGFYDYFDQVNIGGNQLTADELVGALMSL
ncbi:MAG: hypothetical protein KDA91_16050 [Planctomycetaceae bacterium]|nr:hypothetical protein [Planctomycetaceae bacterium]